MSFKIESAQLPDLPRMAELLNDLFGVEFDFTADATRQMRGLEMLIAEAAKNDRQTIIVVRDDNGMVAGMASAQLVISTAEGARSAWLEDVVVHPDFRRQGVGKLLVGHLFAWAKARGATRVQLVADQENAVARLFYTALGWQSTQLTVRRQFVK